jgi:hypothetical protein
MKRMAGLRIDLQRCMGNGLDEPVLIGALEDTVLVTPKDQRRDSDFI